MTQTFGEIIVEYQRPLVRWCAFLSGDPGAADDLAQETLVEAWRNRHKLTDASGVQYWLYAIARNVCLRWRRQMGRAASTLPDEWPSDTSDLDAELEQDELADLVASAMTWLPPETRSALIARYLHGQPPEEVAARLGISENALAVRLHRGKQAMRQTFKTHLRAQAQAYGLVETGDDWQPTRLWCYRCGQQHLKARFDPGYGVLVLACDRCGCTLEDTFGAVRLLDGVRSIKSAVNRLFNWSSQRFAPAGSQILCEVCGQAVLMRIAPKETHRGSEIIMSISCPHCGSSQSQSLYGQAIHHPQGQQFWRIHERIRILPHQFLEIDGHPAALTTLESVRSARQLHVISSLDQGRVLRVEM